MGQCPFNSHFYDYSNIQQNPEKIPSVLPSTANLLKPLTRRGENTILLLSKQSHISSTATVIKGPMLTAIIYNIKRKVEITLGLNPDSQIQKSYTWKKDS